MRFNAKEVKLLPPTGKKGPAPGTPRGKSRRASLPPRGTPEQPFEGNCGASWNWHAGTTPTRRAGRPAVRQRECGEAGVSAVTFIKLGKVIFAFSTMITAIPD